MLSKRHLGSSIWHFSGDLCGPHILPVNITNRYPFQQVNIHEIVEDRHFVGWCVDMVYRVGL